MDEMDVRLKFQENEHQHKLYEKYLDNDKKRLEKQDEILSELKLMTAKLTEQNSQQAELIGQNKQMMLKHIDKPSFWESKNGGKLFHVLLIAGVALLVAAVGFNIMELSNFIN